MFQQFADFMLEKVTCTGQIIILARAVEGAGGGGWCFYRAFFTARLFKDSCKYLPRSQTFGSVQPFSPFITTSFDTLYSL